MDFPCYKRLVLNWRRRAQTQPLLRCALNCVLALPVVGYGLLAVWGWLVANLLCYGQMIDYQQCVGRQIQFWLYILTFNTLFVIAMFCFVRTLISQVPEFPAEWHLSDAQMQQLHQTSGTPQQQSALLCDLIRQRKLVVLTRKRSRLVAYCAVCRIIKPDRTHHCSICDRLHNVFEILSGQPRDIAFSAQAYTYTCRPRFDHHCPWLNKCVAGHNYKPFVCMLVWATVLMAFTALTNLEFALSALLDEVPAAVGLSQPWVCVQVVGLEAAILAVLLSAVLLLHYHACLIVGYETTCEQVAEPYFLDAWRDDRRRFGFGPPSAAAAARLVLGERWWQWPLPVDFAPAERRLFRFAVYDRVADVCLRDETEMRAAARAAMAQRLALTKSSTAANK